MGGVPDALVASFLTLCCRSDRYLLDFWFHNSLWVCRIFLLKFFFHGMGCSKTKLLLGCYSHCLLRIN